MKPPGLSVNVIVPQTRVENMELRRMGGDSVVVVTPCVAAGHQKTVDTEHCISPPTAVMGLVGLVPKIQLYINLRYVSEQSTGDR